MGSKGLNECKNSASNLRGIQVKYIVKEDEDYLKTYSSADMDIRCKWNLRERAKACALDHLCEIVFQETDWASGSPSNTPLVERINDLNLDDVFNEDDDSDVERAENKSLYKQRKESHGEDPYDDDDFDDPGLTNAQMKFFNAFDINLRSQLR
ncbi:hypothetical protein Tco_0617838 [Tanacetum coccineum]